jgi:1,4-dihydroxy-2-naphthoate octaprenyltransferase
MKRITLWIHATRAPFLLAAVVPVLVGTSLAVREGFFDLTAFWFAFLIILSSHTGSNLFNDYCDARGSDLINLNHSPFNGGTRLIQLGLLGESAYLRASVIAFGVSLTTAFILSFVNSNWLIFGLALLGALIGVGYSGACISGMNRGWGELMVGANFGPLAVMGSYLLQTNRISDESFLAGIPVGLFIMGVLILNEFPDIKADAAVNKNNWIVSLGIGKGVWAYLATIALAYTTITLSVVMKIFPAHILYSYLTLPPAVWISLKLWRNREHVSEMIPVMAGNLGLHIIAGLLLCFGLML